MKRLFYLLASAVMSCGCASQYPAMFAHRGCWFAGDVPENSTEAVRMAQRFGYAGIECDVKYTVDSVMVIMHDRSINRTMRNADGYSAIKGKKYVKDMTFKELRENYVLASDDPSKRAVIPTLEELLEECRKCGIIPMLHSSITESYDMAERMMPGKWVAFTKDFSKLKYARKISDCPILLAINGKSDPELVFRQLDTLGGRCGISTMSSRLLSPEFCARFLEKGYDVQASIFKVPKEFHVLESGITYQLTDFSYMPPQGLPETARWKTGSRKLKSGESLQKSWESMEYGAICTELRFKGTLNITLNGTAVYTVTSDGSRTECIGRRFHDTAPSISIKAVNDTQIKSIRTAIHKAR